MNTLGDATFIFAHELGHACRCNLFADQHRKSGAKETDYWAKNHRRGAPEYKNSFDGEIASHQEEVLQEPGAIVEMLEELRTAAARVVSVRRQPAVVRDATSTFSTR